MNDFTRGLAGIWYFYDDMLDVFDRGVKNGREFGDWQRLNWDKTYEQLYEAKLIGHFAQAMRSDSAADKCKHLAAVACNACILWYHAKKEK